ncbi:hypothetical protein CMV_022732 [Castanea mollissima]|uniref:F-box domain-containing protein n=1 Tax=Castanea mollissima TaxID=60419 RepID=A0A8J4VBC0_9ROSI|nr:hypothetical protein CMV_022732 [Castanea mollissima]
MSDNLPKFSKSLFTQQEEEKSTWDSLPPEILLDIIIRLPIKSIITCTSVCKTWKSLIQNPSFISDHLRHSTTKYDHPLLLFRLCSKKVVLGIGGPVWFKDEKEFYALHWDNQNFNEYNRFDDFPFHAQCRRGIFRVVGTCNGLVCLVDDFGCYSHNFILWNPCLRKFVQLPKPNIKFRKHLTYIPSFGFGFDTKTNDYKVVRIMTFRDRDNLGVGESPLKVEVGVEIYSLATGEWKTLTAVPPTATELYGHPHASISGALHWVAFRRIKDDKFLEFVSVLNLEDEVFREIALPKLGINGNRLPTFISAYGNSLALFQKVSMDPLSIWLMEEYGNASSWTKIVTFVDQGPRRNKPQVKGFRKSGEAILLMTNGKLVSRGLETQEIKDLGMAGSYNTFVDSYIESLVLLDKANHAVTY